MITIGCDFHSRSQQIAMVDTETGEVLERVAGSHDTHFVSWAFRSSAIRLWQANIIDLHRALRILCRGLFGHPRYDCGKRI
jgi:hypothetical protein